MFTYVDNVHREDASTVERVGDRVQADDGTGSVKSAERVLRILELLSAEAGPLTPSAIATRAQVPRSSLHALLRTLRVRGWVQEVGAAVTLAPLALTVGVSYLDRDPAVPPGTAVLERLRDELGCTVSLARRVGADVVYLATREAADRRDLPARLGRRVPAFATALGRALLAELTDSEVRDLLASGDRAALTDATVTDVDALVEEVRTARERGRALEAGQTIEGVCCVAVAVPYRMPATDAVSCSMPLEAATPERVEQVGDALAREVAGLGRALRALGVR